MPQSDWIRIMKKQAEKSKGAVKLEKVPMERRPSKESLEKLEREVNGQIELNTPKDVYK